MAGIGEGSHGGCWETGEAEGEEAGAGLCPAELCP